MSLLLGLQRSQSRPLRRSRCTAALLTERRSASLKRERLQSVSDSTSKEYSSAAITMFDGSAVEKRSVNLGGRRRDNASASELARRARVERAARAAEAKRLKSAQCVQRWYPGPSPRGTRPS